MYPPKFDYTAPRTLDEALAVLADKGEDAKILAGGQSLIPVLKLRFAQPAVLVDMNRLEGLAGLEETDTHLEIGAMTRHAACEHSGLLKERYPLLAATARLVADPLVRNLGTVGGSLAHADPAGDWGAAMLAANAEVVIRSSSGERTVPVAEFFGDLLETVLEPHEILTRIRVPRPRGASGGAYLKMERKVGDFATVAAAVQLEMSNGTVGRAGIGLAAVGPRNIRATAAEDALAGKAPSGELFEEAAVLAAEAAEPTPDVRGPAEYKRDIVRVFVKRGLERALDIARS